MNITRHVSVDFMPWRLGTGWLSIPTAIEQVYFDLREFTPDESAALNRLAEHPDVSGSKSLREFLQDLRTGKDFSEGEGKQQRIRTIASRLRSAIQDIYAEDRSFAGLPTIRIASSNRTYVLEFSNPTASQVSLNAFWRPYLECSDLERQIQTADRMFLRLGQAIYIRNVTSQEGWSWEKFLQPIQEQLGVEIVADKIKTLPGMFPGAIAQVIFDSGCFGSDAPLRERIENAIRSKFEVEASRHYISAGESVGLTYLCDFFQGLGKKLIVGNRAQTSPSNSHANLIQIGAPERDDDLLGKLLREQRFVRDVDVIKDRETNEEISDRGAFDPDAAAGWSEDSAPRKAERFVLVTRCPNRFSPYVVTSIVGSHGRATEAVCQYLSEEKSVDSLLQKLGWSDAVPESFQFVLSVTLTRRGGESRTTGETHDPKEIKGKNWWHPQR